MELREIQCVTPPPPHRPPLSAGGPSLHPQPQLHACLWGPPLYVGSSPCGSLCPALGSRVLEGRETDGAVARSVWHGMGAEQVVGRTVDPW